MRETCMTDLAGIWYNLVATYSESNPELAEAVLAAVKRYVSWIDIGLVANDRCAKSSLYLASAPPASVPCSCMFRNKVAHMAVSTAKCSQATGIWPFS